MLAQCQKLGEKEIWYKDVGRVKSHMSAGQQFAEGNGASATPVVLLYVFTEQSAHVY